MTATTTPGPPRLFLVRHGDTAWSDSHRHTGWTDIPLTAAGEDRARQLGRRLRGERFDRLFTSPLVRASRTAELIDLPVPTEPDPDLVEWDYGDYEGRTTADIQRERPGWDLFRDGVPHGESADQIAARADRFLAVARAAGGTVAAVSSAHVIRVIAARWLGLPPQAAAYFYTATASIGILGHEHGRPVILLWNDDGTLDRPA